MMTKKPLFLLLTFMLVQCSNNSTGPTVPSLSDVLISETEIPNPSGYAPLTALLIFETTIPLDIRLQLEGKPGDADLIHSFQENSTSFEIPVLGLYADYLNTVSVTFYTRKGFEIGSRQYTFSTKPLISDMPEIEINTINTAEVAEGWTFVSYFGFAEDGNPSPQKPFMFDPNGQIRWYLDFTGHPQLGNLFYDDGMERLENGNLYFGDGSTNKIYEVNMLGEVLNTWDMPGYGFHHEVLEKPDGNFLVTVNKFGEDTIEDYIIEIDRHQNQIVNVWNLKESLQYDRRAMTNNDYDWFHANAVEYSESDNCIIVSGRTQGVVKLTENNEVVWILGPHKGWETSGRGEDLTQYLLQPLDSEGKPITTSTILSGTANHKDFEWNWYQHAPSLLPNGDLILFDNGDNRNFYNTGPYSRAVTYRIDDEHLTVQQIWQYGKERGDDTFSQIVSDVDYYPEENHVFFSPGAVSNSGIYGKIVEIDYDTREVLFEATITPPKPLYIITFHRTERMNIYPLQMPVIVE